MTASKVCADGNAPDDNGRLGATFRRDTSLLGVAEVRRIATTVALAFSLAGCGTMREPAPSGEPVELDHHTMECSSGSGWAEGTLRADASIYDPMFDSATHSALTAIDIRRMGPSTEPDPSGWLVHVVPVSWPSEYTGVRLASGEVAVADATGSLVATTGRDYRLGGLMIVVAPAGGPLFDRGESWFGALNVCGSPQLIPQQ